VTVLRPAAAGRRAVAGPGAGRQRRAAAAQGHPAQPAARAPPRGHRAGLPGRPAQPDDDHKVAREFLAPDTEWDDEQGAVVYSGRRFLDDDDGDPLSFDVRYDAFARVEATGSYALDDTPVVAPYTVGLMPSGEYRLTAVPPGLHLTSQARERSFTGYDVYFLGRAADGSSTSRLVPDRVVPPVTASVAPALVAALLRGATPALRPAVGTAGPAGTALASPVKEVDGVVTVDLTARWPSWASGPGSGCPPSWCGPSCRRSAACGCWSRASRWPWTVPQPSRRWPTGRRSTPTARSADARLYYVHDRRLGPSVRRCPTAPPPRCAACTSTRWR
jgi:hypothetical protein